MPAREPHVTIEAVHGAGPADRRSDAREAADRAARPAAHLHRRRAGRRQDLLDDRGRARVPARGRRRRRRLRRDARTRRHRGQARAISRSFRGGRVDYRGVVLEEMDVDAILARKPQLCVVDELAHTNAPGSRHEKRYQDVLELLDAGIGVLTAVNIQHLETLNDAVGRVTGVRVRETVPDTFLDRADEVVNVDVTVEELRSAAAAGQGLQAGEGRAGAHELLPRDEPVDAARAGAARRRRRSRREGGVTPAARGARAGAHSRARDGVYELERRRAARAPHRRADRRPAGRALVRGLRRDAARGAGPDQGRGPGRAAAQHRAGRGARRHRRARAGPTGPPTG